MIMPTKNTIIGIVIAVVLLAGAGYLLTSSQSGTRGNTGAPTGAPSAVDTSKTYTLADIQTHNTATNCWSAISGGVYDLTSWISRHPGGEGPIIGMCGTDGTAAYTNQHGTSRRPASALLLLKIGTLKP
jgi:hypothetical protein